MLFSKYLAVATLLVLVLDVTRGNTLKCHRTSQYPMGSYCCPKCQAGSRVKTDCTEFRSTSCVPCEEGTFTNGPTSLKQCNLCTVCDAGSDLQMKMACTSTSDTVCEPLEGFYCLASAADSCTAARRHTSCPPGQYLSQRGTKLDDNVCSNCTDGTFSDGMLSTSCLPHTHCESMKRWLKKPGTASADAECEEDIPRTSKCGIAVIVIVYLLIAVIIIVYFKLKRRCQNTGNRGRKGNKMVSNRRR